MDHSSKQFNHYNEIYPMEYHMFDSDLVEYKQPRYKLLKEAMLNVYVELKKCIEEFGNAIRARNKRNFKDMERLSKEICKTHICIRESLESRQNNPLLSVKSSKLKEDELTTSQTAHSVLLPPIYLSSLPMTPPLGQ